METEYTRPDFSEDELKEIIQAVQDFKNNVGLEVISSDNYDECEDEGEEE